MDTDQIKKIDEQIEQLKNRKRAVLAREREKERKARTRRLIQIGAIAEKYMNCEGVSPEGFEERIKQVLSSKQG